MKKVLGFMIPFTLQHIICCGALLFFLISSGLLLKFSQEGQNRIYLLPALFFAAFLIFLYFYYGRCCKQKGHKTFLDHGILLLIYLLISFVVGIIFMINVFIPSWIPGYQGGPLLP